MIQMQTRLDSADNTGAKELQCIKVLGGTHRRTAKLGDSSAKIFRTLQITDGEERRYAPLGFFNSKAQQSRS